MKTLSLMAAVLSLATAAAWAHDGHSLHDTTQKQRDEMCVYEDKNFAKNIAQKLNCE